MAKTDQVFDQAGDILHATYANAPSNQLYFHQPRPASGFQAPPIIGRAVQPVLAPQSPAQYDHLFSDLAMSTKAAPSRYPSSVLPFVHPSSFGEDSPPPTMQPPAKRRKIAQIGELPACQIDPLLITLYTNNSSGYVPPSQMSTVVPAPNATTQAPKRGRRRKTEGAKSAPKGSASSRRKRDQATQWNSTQVAYTSLPVVPPFSQQATSSPMSDKLLPTHQQRSRSHDNQIKEDSTRTGDRSS